MNTIVCHSIPFHLKCSMSRSRIGTSEDVSKRRNIFLVTHAAKPTISSFNVRTQTPYYLLTTTILSMFLRQQRNLIMGITIVLSLIWAILSFPSDERDEFSQRAVAMRADLIARIFTHSKYQFGKSETDSQSVPTSSLSKVNRVRDTINCLMRYIQPLTIADS